MTTVLVVDDSPLFVTGLSAALVNAGFDVVGQAEDAMTALTMARSLQPDMVVLDVLMPGMSGLEVVGPIREASGGANVVLLTSSESEEDLLSAIKSGARGYVVKDTPFPELVESMRAVCEGGAVVSPRMGAKLFETVASLLKHREVISTRKPELTGRELEVLGLISSGMTSRQIGEKLFISENTVKNHVRNILDKLGLHSRNEAVLYAVREELIQIGG
ncbi:MAG: response regulator [Gammaproteobacteria bacterium]|nr:response regulator [Gammaproteobacteria bacterium]